MSNARNYEPINGKLNIVGAKIKFYRKSQNLSRQNLSDKLILLGIDISTKSICHIENGTRTVVDFEICAICKVLKLPIEALLIDYFNSLP